MGRKARMRDQHSILWTATAWGGRQGWGIIIAYSGQRQHGEEGKDEGSAKHTLDSDSMGRKARMRDQHSILWTATAWGGRQGWGISNISRLRWMDQWIEIMSGTLSLYWGWLFRFTTISPRPLHYYTFTKHDIPTRKIIGRLVINLCKITGRR